jgi:pimeloyl-ACP methyl ester carboxylesterase
MSAALDAWQRHGRCIEWRGHRVFVAQAGRGPALLLIHGYPTGSFDWHSVWEALAARFTVIAPDMLGLGFSDKPRGHAYSLQDHADLHEALIDRLQLRRLSVMAHDLGVSVAQELLARRSEDRSLPPIESLVLLNGGLCPEAYKPRFIQHLLSSPAGPWLGPRIPRRAFDRSVSTLFGPQAPVSIELLDDFWQLANHNEGLRVAHAVGRFYVDRLAMRDRLVGPLLRSSVPIRLINGAADPNSGRHMAERYRAVVPGADIVSLERVGHWPQIEAPQAVLASALPFLAAGTGAATR